MKNVRQRVGWPFILFISLVISPGAASADDFALQLKWSPQAQFMGYYVAKTLGYYEEEDLQIEILPGGMGIEPINAIREGLADAVIEWLPTALAARDSGTPLVNIAQFFQHSGLLLVCRRDRNIVEPADLQNRTISVWLNGNQVPLIKWLESLSGSSTESSNGIRIVEQGSAYEAWQNKAVDCVSAMSYNEYWRLIEHGVDLSNTTIFKLEDLGFSLLEDGLYVDARRLSDPSFNDRLTRFLQASIRGWKYAIDHPVEAVELLRQAHPELSEHHQLRMAEEIVRLVDSEQYTVGLLNIESFEQTIDLLKAYADDKSINSDLRNAWTHALWNEVAPQSRSAFSIEVRYRLQQVLSTNAFYLLDLIGTLAFGIAGFARAQQRKYDLWGALVVTSLPAVGGGTLRDLLVGGDRHPPFIFTDSTYIYIIIAIVFVGSLANLLAAKPRAFGERFPTMLLIIDTIGLAAFSIIGAKVAIIAELDWFWIPCLAALTCAGGGVLLDIVTAREPRTFRGKIYEEIAILGGLFFAAMLYLGNYAEDVYQHIVIATVLTFLVVFCTRIAVVKLGLSAPVLHAKGK